MQGLFKFTHIFFFIVLNFISCPFYYVNSQDSNSCNSPLIVSNSVLFDTSSLHCAPVWQPENYVLRYAQAAPNVWSYVLSTPNPNAYVAIGFSPDGQMVGSTAIVGWADTGGTTYIKKYYLGGQSPNLVRIQLIDQGLQIANATTVLQSNQLYLAFQLITNTPNTRLIYSVGETGLLPGGAPNFQLAKHRTMISTTMNYAMGEFQNQDSPQATLKRNHGILNMLGWGILIPIGAMIARYARHWDLLWFYAHATIQSLAFILGLIGVICGLVLENRLDLVTVTKHKTLGIIILVLGSLQVIAILVRPDTGSKVRKYWNLYHHNVGRILIILAAANVFYGIHLANAGSSWNTGFAVILVALFVIALILELRMWLKK